MCFKWIANLFLPEEEIPEPDPPKNCRACFETTYPGNPQLKETKYFERRFCKFKTCEEEDPRLKDVKSPIS